MAAGSGLKRTMRIVLISGAIALAMLFIPEPEPDLQPVRRRSPFVWNQDEYWSILEAQFRAAKALDCSRHRESIEKGMETLARHEAQLHSVTRSPHDSFLVELERDMFEVAPMLGACPDSLPRFLRALNAVRASLKALSREWDMNDTDTRNRMYRLLYGSRAAAEEVMLQAPAESLPALVVATEEPSVTPSIRVLDMMLHSGDILVSRGGAPTSALIARASDFPGNFSHVALVHVDSATGIASILESHIERGVTISTVQEYLNDVKLRILVLRIRHDLPVMKADPMLPHRAASLMKEEAASRHIPYDFGMDSGESSSMFCSEVASAAYARVGIRLWMGMSSISGNGIIAWLAALGVRHFETQEPSDLEYDPQLQVVGEWRDPETLFKDHVDNAVIDALLEEAEAGRRLQHDWFLLPVARLAKAYSALLNFFGGVGPVPEGMSATAALRVRWLSSQHAETVERVKKKAEEFRISSAYQPPYWELIRFAREARAGR